LDILINNAAAYVDWSEMASTTDLDAAERVMRVNLFGSWRMIQAFAAAEAKCTSADRQRQ
jgi:NAD(P)-dependent dehydrogenase (short-subunit alcohol dehydrogenase family)